MPDEDADDVFEAALFTNEEYEERTESYGDIHVRLLSSKAATTDHDLTGQIVWPATPMLARYLASHKEIFEGQHSALELGSGLGLVGLLAAHFLPTVLTDHNEVVLRVLRRNVALNTTGRETRISGGEAEGPFSSALRHPHTPRRCLRMDWEDGGEVAATRAASPGGLGYDLVLGADVAYSLRALPGLLRCVAHLLRRARSARFLLGYISRAGNIDAALPVEAEAAGLSIAAVSGTQTEVAGGLTGQVYACCWQQHLLSVST